MSVICRNCGQHIRKTGGRWAHQDGMYGCYGLSGLGINPAKVLATPISPEDILKSIKRCLTN